MGRGVWVAYLRTGAAAAIFRVSLLVWVNQRFASHTNATPSYGCNHIQTEGLWAVLNNVIAVVVALTLWLPGNRPWSQTQTLECVAPRYTLGPFTFPPTSNSDRRHMTIAIAEEAFTRPALRCLAGALAREQGSARALGVTIFDSKWAADRYSPGLGGEMTPVRFKVLSHLHAAYVKDETGQYLFLNPIGSDGGGLFESRLNLQRDSPDDCRLSIQNRCLMAMDHLAKLPVMLDDVPAPIQLAAELDRAGRLRHVVIVSRGLSGMARQFAEHTARTMKGWRFEPAADGRRIPLAVTARVSGPLGSTKMDMKIDDSTSPVTIQVAVGATAGPIPEKYRK